MAFGSKKRYKVEILSYANGEGSHEPKYDDIKEKILDTDICMCSLGAFSTFIPCNPDKYRGMLVVRFKTEELRQQYLNLDFKELINEFVSSYGTSGRLTPWRWFEIVSKHINLNPED